MKLREVYNKLSDEAKKLWSSSIVQNGKGLINLDNTVAIGVPNLSTYTDGPLVFPDADYIATKPFIVLQPLDLKFEEISDIFNLTVNIFRPVNDKVPSLAIFASENSTFNIEVVNNIDSSLLETVMNKLSQVGGMAQSFGFGAGISSISQAAGNLADNIASPLGAALYALAGYKFSGPKIWTDGSVETSIKITAKHDMMMENYYDEERIMEIFSTIKAFTVPRTPDEVVHSDNTKGTVTTNASNTTNPDTVSTQHDPVRGLTKLQYKYPYFCKVIHGNTGNVVYDVAIVTSFSTTYDFLNISNLTLRQIPSIVEFSFTIHPLLPFRADIRDNENNYPATSVNKLLTSVVKTGYGRYKDVLSSRYSGAIGKVKYSNIVTQKKR